MQQPSLEERVAYLEGRMQDHTALVLDLRSGLRELRDEMGRRFEAVDRRFEAVDKRFDAVDRRFDAVDRHFTWLVGIQVAMLVAVVSALVSAYYW